MKIKDVKQLAKLGVIECVLSYESFKELEDCVKDMLGEGITSIETSPQPEDEWPNEIRLIKMYGVEIRA